MPASIRAGAGSDGSPVHLKDMNRYFSESYLWLTHAKEACGDPNHSMVNWIDSMSEPSPLPPYHRGAATSGLMQLLTDGHEGVRLSREERERIACWIDLLVPYCGNFTESNTWSRKDLATYARFRFSTVAGLLNVVVIVDFFETWIGGPKS